VSSLFVSSMLSVVFLLCGCVIIVFVSISYAV
jgi:hypothetical protein